MFKILLGQFARYNPNVEQGLPKKIKLFLQLGRLTYKILALNELMKKIFPKCPAPVFSTEPAWLAYVRVGTSPSQAGSVEKIEAVYLAKKIFH